ncbi:diguanylate cyclase [Marinobacterium jannaschii]|uniref:diguanylate cyclase n=1 Tax=Marinobacterium jannaschii TaxID=64970 RepID=UPI0014720C77|nr:diguanylate cyclase [Marinobacterium jannaschii]
MCILLGCGLSLQAAPLRLSQSYADSIGDRFWLLQEASAPLTASQALNAFLRSEFHRSTSKAINLGLNARPVWLLARLENDTGLSVLRRIQIENAWLERVDIYIAREGAIEWQRHSPDLTHFSEHSVKQRFFAIDYNFPPGESLLLIRTQQAGPMLLPVYLLQLSQAEQRTLEQAYSYALLYGALGALLLYNLMLYAGLRDTRYLLYSLYMLAFLLANISYTGHGHQWLWPASASGQHYANITLLSAYIVTGLLFSIRFLNLSALYPGFTRRLHFALAGSGAIIMTALLAEQYLAAVYLVFAGLTLFPFLMVGLGLACLREDRRNAMYFLLGSVFIATGTTISAATSEGLIPYTVFNHRAIELGMLLDATLLAAALAFRFREIDGRRSKAERLASIDPLTGIFNRRAFYERAEPLWNSSARNQRTLCILMLDIDHFKKINDQYGHGYGDRVLAHIALAMKQELRSFDLLARWGGEEFILLLPDTSVREGIRVAERIRQRISDLSHSWGLPEIKVSASLGVAAGMAPTRALDELISEADTQLYQAKARGRNRVCGPCAPRPQPGKRAAKVR